LQSILQGLILLQLQKMAQLDYGTIMRKHLE